MLHGIHKMLQDLVSGGSNCHCSCRLNHARSLGLDKKEDPAGCGSVRIHSSRHIRCCCLVTQSGLSRWKAGELRPFLGCPNETEGEPFTGIYQLCRIQSSLLQLGSEANLPRLSKVPPFFFLRKYNLEFVFL